MKPASVFFLVLACLDLQAEVTCAPICARGHTGCQALSIADLFDRVIQHSTRIHHLSDNLHSEFEQYFPRNKYQIGRANQKCPTSDILTPDDKENAQTLEREKLTAVILKLLVAWRDPLSQLYQNMARHQDFTSISSNKAWEMSDSVHQLAQGVEKVAEKMQLLGLISNSLSSPLLTEALVQASPDGEAPPMSDYDLLHCFRRDSSKVQSYLRILQCRILPEGQC